MLGYCLYKLATKIRKTESFEVMLYEKMLFRGEECVWLVFSCYFCILIYNVTVGKLYVVPTPVGNMEDMTFRAVRVLKEADFILAEDTRTSGVLLQHFEVRGELLSHHKYNEHGTVEAVVRRLKGGETAAVVSDAGTPGISDPGFLLVRECVRAGVEVETLPGATAFVPALVSSGMPCDKFCFEGFLPQKKGRMTRLKALEDEVRTMVLYESPRRLVKTLGQLAEVMGEDRAVCVAREISKVHEEHVRGTLAEVRRHFEMTEPLGEIVIVLAGKGDDEVDEELKGEDECRQMLMGKGKSKNKYK